MRHAPRSHGRRRRSAGAAARQAARASGQRGPHRRLLGSHVHYLCRIQGVPGAGECCTAVPMPRQQMAGADIGPAAMPPLPPQHPSPAFPLQAAALRAMGWDEARLKDEHWAAQHAKAAQQMYSLCVDLRGFYLKVRAVSCTPTCLARAPGWRDGGCASGLTTRTLPPSPRGPQTGQFIGARGDFVPEQICRKLSLLHDQVRAAGASLAVLRRGRCWSPACGQGPHLPSAVAAAPPDEQ